MDQETARLSLRQVGQWTISAEFHPNPHKDAQYVGPPGKSAPPIHGIENGETSKKGEEYHFVITAL